MKKPEIKKLKLNKKIISKLDLNKVQGGRLVDGNSWLFPGCDTHPRICVMSDYTCTVVSTPCPPQTKQQCGTQYTCACTDTIA